MPRGWTFPTYPTEYAGYTDLEFTLPRTVNIHHHYEMRFKTTGQTISPSYLFNVRIIQVALALVYLVLLCYSGVHHGWWLNLRQPLGFGSACSPSPHHSLCALFGPSTAVFGEEWSPFSYRLYDLQSPNHVIARRSSNAQQSAWKSKRARPLHRHQTAVLVPLLTLPSLSIAPDHPSRHARHSQTRFHALEYALHLPGPFPPRAFRSHSHRTLVRRLRHHVATQRQGFQIALQQTTVRPVELCGCVCCD